MRKEIFEKRLAAIKACADEGLTMKEAAEKLGVCYDTIRNYSRVSELTFSKISRADAARKVRLEELSRQGKTRQEAAETLGLSYPRVSYLIRLFDIDFRHGLAGPEDDERTEAMSAMYRGGKTLQEIGVLFGVSRERVRQIITKANGSMSRFGGQSAKAKASRRERDAKAELKCQQENGCSVAQLRSLRKMTNALLKAGARQCETPLYAFRSQRNNAIRRGIEWKLTVWEWWTMWQESGKWDQRGRRADGYVMSRFADDGAYEVGNVYICTLRHNSSFQPNNPYRKSHPDFEKTMAKKARSGPTAGKCTIDGCGHRHFGQGYCNNHYYHFITKPKKLKQFEASGVAA